MADGTFTTLVEDGGYGAVGGLLLVENLFPPIPSEAILPLAGYFVGRGALGFVPVLLVATLGATLGALVLYAVGRWGGRPLLERWGRVVRLDAARLDRADAWFDRHGAWVVLLGRLVPGVRSLVSIPAGASEMPLGRFVVLTAVGSALWNAALIGAGLALGSRWTEVGAVVGPLARIVVVVLAAGLAALAVALLVRRRRATA